MISEQSPEKSEQVNVTEMEAGKCTEFYLLYPKPRGKRKKKKRQGEELISYYFITLPRYRDHQNTNGEPEKDQTTHATEERLIELMKGAQVKGTSLLTTAGA